MASKEPIKIVVINEDDEKLRKTIRYLKEALIKIKGNTDIFFVQGLLGVNQTKIQNDLICRMTKEISRLEKILKRNNFYS